MKILHNSKRFQYAHLNPDLAQGHPKFIYDQRFEFFFWVRR